MSEKVHIYISDDGMKAYLLTKDILNANIIPEDIRAAAKKSGIKYGFKGDLIKNCSFTDLEGDICVIAVGQLPTHKDDAELVWYINTRNPLLPQINESGRADFKKLQQFEEVKKGQELVSKIPPTIIKPGKSVTGEDIQYMRITSDVSAGKNIAVSSDGLSLRAEIDGNIFWKDNVIHVDDMYKIRGNVDYHTGNIKFNGSVFIGGDVKSGFRVEATDDIFIQGNIEAADVLSKGGDILVQLGIVGGKKARIIAGGNLRCGYIQDATVGVKRSVYVERYIMNSSVTAEQNIFASENEGLIRGGGLSARERIVANEIGSEYGIPTEIKIRGRRGSSLEPAKMKLSKRRIELNKKLTILTKRKEFLILLKDRLSNLSDSKQQELITIQKDIEKIHKSIQVLSDNQSKFTTNSIPVKNREEIVVNKQLHRAVSITIGLSQFVASSQLESVRLYENNKEILIEPIVNIMEEKSLNQMK